MTTLSIVMLTIAAWGQRLVGAFLIGLAMVLAVPINSPLIAAVHHINNMLHKILSWVILTTPFSSCQRSMRQRSR